MRQVVLGRGLRALGCCAALGSVWVAGEAAAGQDSTGCTAANRGALNMRAMAGGNAVREAAFDAGDRLTIALSTSGTAAVTVSTPDGEVRTLHSGRATSMTFVAPGTAPLGFRLDADASNAAALDVTCASKSRVSAERSLADRRRAFLAGREPDRVRIDRPRTEPKAIDSFTPSPTEGALPREVTASISLSELAAAMKLGEKNQPTILDFWFEGRHETYDTIDMDARPNDGSFAAMSFGSHYMLGPDIMLGYLAQFDQLGEYSRYSGSVSTKGWMAGPYVSVRFGHGIIFDGRAAQGRTEIAPDGVMVVPAERTMVRGTLRGERQLGGWTLAPSVGLSYVEDTPKFRDTAFSDARPVGSGRLDVLPAVKRRFDLDSKTYIEPRIAAGGFLSFDDISRLAPGGVTAAAPDLHWKAEAGLAWGVKDSMSLQATGGVETGGQSATDTWSGRLQLNVPLGQ
jgi:hypothetical protein